MIRKILALILALIGGGPALAEGVSAHDAYARSTPPGARTAAAFLTLQGGAEDDRLISVSSPQAGRVEIHETREDAAGILSMRELAGGLPLPAGEAAILAPGGAHLMLFDLTGPLEAGETARFTLIFESGARLEAEAPILSPREMRGRSAAPAAHH